MAQIFGALLVGKAAFHSGVVPVLEKYGHILLL